MSDLPTREQRIEKRERRLTDAVERATRETIQSWLTSVCGWGRHDECKYGVIPGAFECLCECHDGTAPDAGTTDRRTT